MKVVHICPHFRLDFPHWHERVIIKQSEMFNYDIEVITTNLSAGSPTKYEAGIEKINNIKIIRLPSFEILALGRQSIPRNFLLLKVKKADIIHLHGYGQIMNQISIFLNKNIPHILKPDVGSEYPDYNPLKKLEKKIFATYNTVIEKKYLIRKGFNPNKLFKVGFGVDYYTYEEIGKEFNPIEGRILMIAQIIPIKNIELAIKAVSKLSDPKLKLVVIGPIRNKSYFIHLLNLVQTLGLKEQVQFKGYVRPEEIPREIAKSMLTLVTSKRESGPAVILESLSVGRPVISTPVNLARDLNKGIILTTYNTDNVANKIYEILNFNAYWKKISTYGQKYAKTFDWSVICSRVNKVYEKALNSNFKAV